MKIGICDDDLVQINYLTFLISKWSMQKHISCDVVKYQSAEEMLFLNSESFPFDIVILDIQMGEMNGMVLARKIREIDKNIIIIFLSGVSHFVFEGYEVGAFRYLLKPIKEDELFPLLDTALDKINKNQKQYYIFSYEGELIKLDIDDIYYIESLGHYVVINTCDKNFEIKKNIGQILGELKSTFFLNVHRSYIVNLKHIEKINKNDCELSNRVNIPVSRSQYKSLNEAFIAFYRGESS